MDFEHSYSLFSPQLSQTVHMTAWMIPVWVYKSQNSYGESILRGLAQTPSKHWSDKIHVTSTIDYEELPSTLCMGIRLAQHLGHGATHLLIVRETKVLGVYERLGLGYLIPGFDYSIGRAPGNSTWRDVRIC
jgi:hypothetical protein